MGPTCNIFFIFLFIKSGSKQLVICSFLILPSSVYIRKDLICKHEKSISSENQGTWSKISSSHKWRVQYTQKYKRLWCLNFSKLNNIYPNQKNNYSLFSKYFCCASAFVINYCLLISLDLGTRKDALKLVDRAINNILYFYPLLS